jgi:hypothetical protein
MSTNENPLLTLAYELEWVGCELEFYGHKHAMEGYPEKGPTWEAFVVKQRGVLATCDKVERELKGAIRYNQAVLVGTATPVEAKLNTVVAMLAAVEDIREKAVYSVHELPERVRTFARVVEDSLSQSTTVQD